MSFDPPKWANKFLEWFCDPSMLEDLQGDIYESFNGKVKQRNYKIARLHFIWMVLRSFRLSVINFNYSPKTTRFIMINNYMKIAIRNILKQKAYSIINILGLALGISATIVIVLFARYELTYDQWHKNSENIYMVYKERVTPTGVQPTYDTWVPLLGELINDFPEVENGTRLYNDDDIKITVEDELYIEDIYYVDQGYFELFDFPLVEGNNLKPFTNMNSVVISQEIANKFYGKTNPMGKELIIGSDSSISYIVSGVMAKYPSNASVANGIIVQLESNPGYNEVAREWGSSFIYTYILLPHKYKQELLEVKFPAFITALWDKETQERTNFKLLPLHDSYNTFIGDSSDSYILMYIALGIIIIASINFMNLSTARSMERAKEIGVRKIMGAHKTQLANQFLSEALMMTTFSLGLALILAELVIPVVNQMFSMSLEIDYFGNISTLPSLILFCLGLGLLSGSYPAFVLSNFKILESLKGVFTRKGGSINMRNTLVVIQFAISLILIIGTLIITNQIKFMNTTDLAFNKDNLIVVPISPADFDNPESAQGKIQTFRSQIFNYSSVKAVTQSRHVPGRWTGSNTFVRPDGFEGNPMRMRYTYMDAAFFDTYEVDLIEGPGFLPDTNGDQRESAIINEAAMKALGWQSIEGKVISLGSSGNTKINVVGLIKDFNYESLRQQVEPIIHFHRIPTNGTHRYLTIRTSGQDFKETLSYIENNWSLLNTDLDFEFFFVDDDMSTMYANEDRLFTMVVLFSFLSIFVSCLGLFGLSSYIIDRRKKEIGIRKVLGASSLRISVLISNGFTKLVFVAFIIAAPIAYYLMDIWLADFAYHISIGFGVFLLAISMSIAIAWLTVSIKSMQAAQANPVDSIRNE